MLIFVCKSQYIIFNTIEHSKSKLTYRWILYIMSYHRYNFREIDPYDIGIRSGFHDHSPEIRHDRKKCIDIFFDFGRLFSLVLKNKFEMKLHSKCCPWTKAWAFYEFTFLLHTRIKKITIILQ